MFNRDPYIFANHDAIPKPVLAVILGILQSWDQADQSKTDYAYISHFHPTGILHVAPDPTTGVAGLRKLHDDMIHPDHGPVVSLQHYLDRVFLMPNPPAGKTEAVFTGKLTNVLKTGQEVTTDFATWIVLSSDEQGTLKTELLRVFSDTSVLMSAMGKMAEEAEES